MRNSDPAYTSRLSLYLKVANILRSRILKGIWRDGERLPNIMSLCSEFKVGRITVRQAFHLLSEEGLIDSRRGRGTFVTIGKKQASQNKNVTRSLMNAGQQTQILEIGPAELMPYNLWGDYQAPEEYVRVRKLRRYKDQPFCLMDIYVRANLFAEFPQAELSNKTIAVLVQQYSKLPIHKARQVLGISVADYETANLLECHMAAPVAEVDRFFVNAENELISRGHYLYRGDLFYMETEHMGDPVTDAASGWLPVVKQN